MVQGSGSRVIAAREPKGVFEVADPKFFAVRSDAWPELEEARGK
jgi:hypothetical protein